MTQTITLYGIPNCDTVKKARVWLTEQGIDYAFHNFKKDGLSADLLKTWMQTADWKRLLNTRGTSWRKLSDEERANPSADKAQSLMLANPSLVKRPVVETPNGLLIGFDLAQWQTTFGKNS